jgi:hypothetical protein
MTKEKKCVLCGCLDHKIFGCNKHVAKKCSCYNDSN